MGIFSKLFGAKKQAEAPAPELRLKYNIMSNIALATCAKHSNQDRYELIENGIYKDLEDEDSANHRMCISYELDADDTQYPLEDVLDKYYMHVEDFLEDENDPDSNVIIQEMGGTLDDLRKAQEIMGKCMEEMDFFWEERR